MKLTHYRLPQQLFLPKLPPLREPRFFCSISLVSSACLCRIFVGSVSALLHQAPIGIKVLVVFLEHPFRTSGPEYRRYHTVSKGRYNRHGFSPPLSGSRHGQQMRQTKAYVSGVNGFATQSHGIVPTK
jgi:hypothetical protein